MEIMKSFFSGDIENTQTIKCTQYKLKYEENLEILLIICYKPDFYETGDNKIIEKEKVKKRNALLYAKIEFKK